MSKTTEFSIKSDMHAAPVLIDELQDLKSQGLRGLYLSDATWNALMDAAAKMPPPVPVTPATKPSVEAAKPLAQAQSKPAEATPAKPLPTAPTFTLPEGDKSTQMAYVKAMLAQDAFCQSQLKPGKHTVLGVGNLDADIFFCGEAPGAEEEIQQEPFVGPAGQLLTKIIQAMGLSREQVYIANIMNWRPHMPTAYGNRPPTQEEMDYCQPYFRAQLDIVRPKVIVALGATAVAGLLGADPHRKMGDTRGRWKSFEGYPVMSTYHPSYLLRNATQKSKRQVWEDILLVMERLEMSISEKQRQFFS